jgi:CheY-like chemotaxis protein
MGTANGRILVIDDEEAVRKSFLLALEKSRCAVDVAESGETGIEMFRACNYDLVFLDLKMPGMDGVTTLRAIRAVSASVPVYIVTAFHQAFLEGLGAAERDGVEFDLLQKPVEAGHIRLLANNLIAGGAGGAAGAAATTEALWQFRLYVAGQTQRSREAARSVSALLETALPGRYSLAIVDVLRTPDAAREYDVFATPTLVKTEPPPIRKVVGDFRDRGKVMAGLGIKP